MSDKKLITKAEWIFLLIAVLIIAYIILNNNGIHMIEREEKVEIIDRPVQKRTSKKELKKRKKARDKRQKELDEMLEKWGKELGHSKPNTLTSNTWKNSGIPTDEVNFHKKMSKKHDWEGRYEKTKDWFAVLQTSHKTYAKVKNIFQDPQHPKSDLESMTEDVSNLLGNEYSANLIYTQIEELFNIPKENSEKFAQGRKKTVSDWAEFIDENK